ncbi:hypothetical protein SORBI_3004G130001 [Sorghum bicolor]|uniref:Uncharacterized protein n=1 Tax=Sorghum bicolor TaxID=4558 RepID=A0A1Z5RN65_SORBI|nr:hypothetical protein SORBI_3004G130001 [Sorghum bicolor]
MMAPSRSGKERCAAALRSRTQKAAGVRAMLPESMTGKGLMGRHDRRLFAEWLIGPAVLDALARGRVMDALGVEKLKGLEPGCHFERWPNCGGLFPTGNACWCCWGYRGGCGDTEAECKGICHP